MLKLHTVDTWPNFNLNPGPSIFHQKITGIQPDKAFKAKKKNPFRCVPHPKASMATEQLQSSDAHGYHTSKKLNLQTKEKKLPCFSFALSSNTAPLNCGNVSSIRCQTSHSAFVVKIKHTPCTFQDQRLCLFLQWEIVLTYSSNNDGLKS